MSEALKKFVLKKFKTREDFLSALDGNQDAALAFLSDTHKKKGMAEAMGPILEKNLKGKSIDVDGSVADLANFVYGAPATRKSGVRNQKPEATSETVASRPGPSGDKGTLPDTPRGKKASGKQPSLKKIKSGNQVMTETGWMGADGSSPGQGTDVASAPAFAKSDITDEAVSPAEPTFQVDATDSDMRRKDPFFFLRASDYPGPNSEPDPSAGFEFPPSIGTFVLPEDLGIDVGTPRIDLPPAGPTTTLDTSVDTLRAQNPFLFLNDRNYPSLQEPDANVDGGAGGRASLDPAIGRAVAEYASQPVPRAPIDSALGKAVSEYASGQPPKTQGGNMIASLRDALRTKNPKGKWAPATGINKLTEGSIGMTFIPAAPIVDFAVRNSPWLGLGAGLAYAARNPSAPPVDPTHGEDFSDEAIQAQRERVEQARRGLRASAAGQPTSGAQ